jgi:hypothetical protein
MEYLNDVWLHLGYLLTHELKVTRRYEMKLPGFRTKALLDPTAGVAQQNTVSSRSGKGQVLPMAPCCEITQSKSLKVTYPHTKCGPLRDFITAPITDAVFLEDGRGIEQSAAQEMKPVRFTATKLTTLGKTIFDQQVCVTSRGPWNATLTENWPCQGAPYKQLSIDAFGENVSFVWQGGIEMHPPNVGLVSCRVVGTDRFSCGGSLSSCECPSSTCPPTELCDCGFEGIW